MILSWSKSYLLVILHSQEWQEEKPEERWVETGFQEDPCSWLSCCGRGSLAGKIPISITLTSVLLWNFVLDINSVWWSRSAAQGWKWQWLYAAIWWQNATLPLPVSQTSLPMGRPWLEHLLMCKTRKFGLFCSLCATGMSIFFWCSFLLCGVRLSSLWCLLYCLFFPPSV